MEQNTQQQAVNGVASDRRSAPGEASQGEVSQGLASQGMQHDAEAKRKLVNRLRRAQGQLGAVVDAIERDAHCRDVVQQLSAVSKAIDRAGFLVISTALQECLANPDAEGAPDREELEKLFMSLA